MSNILKTLAAGSAGGDYQISRSLRFNSADSAYLSRTPASAGNRKTWTWSGWVKRANISPAGSLMLFSASNADGLSFGNPAGGAGDIDSLTYRQNDSGAYIVVSASRYRDASSWYHVVLAVDTTQATESNRVKLYVNGVQVTAFDSTTYPSQDTETIVNSAVEHNIGRRAGATTYLFNGYLADVHFIDGQALTPSSFGETDEVTGVWKPIRYTGSYGINGFRLDFSDNTSTTALGYDAAGSNDWTPNNFSVTAGAGNDSLVDSPTQYGTDTGAGGEVRGNYATMNPLDNYNTNAAVAFAFSNGNLDVTRSAQSWASSRSTMAMSSGKWYAEMTVTASTAGTLNAMFGIAKQDFTINDYFGGQAGGYGYNAANGQKYNGGAGVSYGATFGLNDVIGVAYDADAGSLTFYKNGSSQGTAYTGLSGTFCFAIGLFPQTSGSITATLNCGQRPFAYTAPSGFKALCTTNLPDPTIVQGDDYFNTVLYTGNGSTQSITGVGFQPDWVWVKSRNDTYNNLVWDAVRGASNVLQTNLTNAEAAYAGFTSFNTDGFSVSTNSGTTGATNNSGKTYVGWNWKANGAGSSNTDGTITSTVSANTTAGISIVTYTGNGTAGATVGHGLGVAPSMIILKFRNASSAWSVYHASLGNTKRLTLNTTDAENTSTDHWNNTSPTSTVFTVGTNFAQVFNYVAYCFAEVEGFSKFGSYTGNGSTDGPFIYTGFRPAFVIMKCSSSTGNWKLHDAARDPYNVSNKFLLPNSSDAEVTGTSNIHGIDLISNGVKIRGTSTTINSSGATYIYAAFAESPFKTSLAR